MEAGLCLRCGKPRGADRGDVTHCHACSGGMNEQRNRARHGRPLRPRGPKAIVRIWNYGTDDLITANIPIARRMAWKAWRKVGAQMDVNDVVGEALYGLTKAGRTFHLERGVPFEAWAVLKIRSAIWHGVKRWVHGYQKQPPKFVALTGREVA
jgi:DNA-directed RNA polymerase sigma subunit (sigma70/sigma32)